MKSLIVGATGFVGANLVRYLNGEGVLPRIFRRRSSNARNISRCKYEDFIGELSSENDIIKAVSGCDIIYYLASCTSLHPKNKELRWHTNVSALQFFTKILLENNVRSKLVYCSSVGAIGSTANPVILTEKDCLEISEFDYFQTKRAAEGVILEAVERGLNAVIVRPATMIGPCGDRFMANAVILSDKSWKLLFYTSGGTSITFVDDVCRGMKLAAERGLRGEAYILSGHNVTFREYYEAIAHELGCMYPKIHLPNFCLMSLGKMGAFFLSNLFCLESVMLAGRFTYFSSEKAQRILGYKISPLSQMIKLTHASRQVD